MSEKQANYLPPPKWQTTAYYHLHRFGLPYAAPCHCELQVRAPDAIGAAQHALDSIQRAIPAGSTVFNLVLTVSLIVPDRSGE